MIPSKDDSEFKAIGPVYTNLSMKLRRVHDISLLWGRIQFRLLTPVWMRKSTKGWNVKPGKKYKVNYTL